MKKTLYKLITAIVVLSMGMLCSCSEDNEGFITATEDDFPQILLPWFGDWENGEPAVYKTISRDAELIDSTVVTPALYTTVEWLIDDEKVCEGTKIYNPQNEMFRHFRTKCSISQNETYLRESFSLPINQIKKHRKNLLLRCFFIACLFGYLAKIH